MKDPLIVVGDFNDTSQRANVSIDAELFDDAWIDGRGTGEGFSYPADKPAKRIDYIFTRRTDGIKTKRAWVVSTLASDHIPVVADLELPNP